MAISGSLNFISSSDMVIYQDGDDPYFALPRPMANAQGFAEWYTFDFVGLNIGLVDPVSGTTNQLGHTQTRFDESYVNRFAGNGITGYNDLIALTSDAPARVLNPLLLHRNGPYQHPSWKQIRGGDHPLARAHRLNNTMSIDQARPDPLLKHEEQRMLQIRRESPNQAEGYFHYPGASAEDNKQLTGDLMKNPDLAHFYEPSVISKYKPFLYSVTVGSPSGPKLAQARASFMNQIKFFTNDKLNYLMKITSGDIASGSSDVENWNSKKHFYYNVLKKASELGAGAFVYSERFFPRSINAYRAFKLEKPNYEESAGYTLSGYDRKINRSFWRDDQGGGLVSATSGTTRLRTANQAKNSADTIQNMQFITGALRPSAYTSRVLIGGNLHPANPPGTASSPTNAVAPTYFSASLRPVQFIENGIVSNQQNTLSSSWSRKDSSNLSGTSGGGLHVDGPTAASFAQLESYQPYNIALLSMWPLDPRQDIYDKPIYLTSSFGGMGLQIGLTPHKAGNFPGADTNFGSPVNTGSAALTTTQALHAATAGMLTGSAGELAYSTKPTIFFFRTGSSNEHDGYHSATASLQYHRHTFPYNSPFYAAHKIRSRNPMYNSYENFAQEGMKYIGRDYSIIPEFRLSENFDYYQKHFFGPDSFVNNPDLFVIDEAPDFEYSDSAKKIRRNFGHFSHLEVALESSPKNKLNFLKLDGADVTSSADDVGSASGKLFTKTIHDYSHISGATAITLPNEAVSTYARDSTAVAFYEKYSHTDDLVDFTHVMDLAGGFKDKQNTVPTAISFVCHGLKKLLPYSGFYPAVRTTQIGTHFIDFISPYVGRGTSATADNAITNAQPANLAPHLQTLIEPFFGPGLLYNSIKSGVAVEYPVYTTDPYYYAPHSFILSSHGYHTGSGFHDSPAAPFTDMRFQLEASQSFPYGGFQMLGASRCIPSVLNSRPDTALPFEALYDATALDQFEEKKNKQLRLVTDFVDLDRNTSLPNTSGSAVTASGRDAGLAEGKGVGDYHPGLVQGTRDNNHPATFLNGKMSDVVSSNKNLYYSSMNNFLCETMDFFLDDTEIPGVKLPIALSEAKNSDDLQINSDMTYYMDVSLNMGIHQVMCEGPRDAGVGGGEAINNDYAGAYKNAKMRGYIYGPPTEIVIHHQDGGDTMAHSGARALAFTEGQGGRPFWLPNGTVTKSTSSVPVRDYESYFAANLQDPAYQAYTPPYFYGESAMVVSYKFDNVTNVSPHDFGMQEIFEHAESNSFNAATYHTGSGFGRDLIGLCKTAPHTASISNGIGERMSIEASVDIFNDPILLTDPGRDANNKHMWFVAPKWVCPVLDFSSSVSAVRLEQPAFNKFSAVGAKTIYYSYIENDYHDNTTGKGMWGGYGTDPYDLEAMQAVYDNMTRDSNKISDTSLAEKGIYLEIKRTSFVADSAFKRNTALQSRITTIDDSRAIDQYFLDRAPPGASYINPTGSLVDILGFEEKKYEIGKMAPQKSVSEAVVLIPYFEEPIRIVANNTEAISGATKEIYSTREIIPGKFFLPIHSNTFENALSVVLSNRHYKGDESFFAASSINSVLSTDAGKMIDRLVGRRAVSGARKARKGYQLPPEFDFIHNKSVSPFQMIVMPMTDELSRQDLLDIYQGVMPDSSMKFKKIKSTPFRTSPDLVTEDTSWHTFAALGPTKGASIDNLSSVTNALHTANFLSPNGCLVETNNFFKELADAGHFDIDSEEQIIPNWLRKKSSSKQFYKKLKFMVFKVKQQAEKDYQTYRKRQIAKAVQHKINSGENSHLRMPDEYTKVLKNTKFNEVYGANWPYDYFSLIESVKIDIEIEVST